MILQVPGNWFEDNKNYLMSELAKVSGYLEKHAQNPENPAK